MVDYMLQYRKAVVPGSPAPNGVVEMRPPSDRGSTGQSNPMYNYHETVYRHPVVARMQFVFSATATTNGTGQYQRHIILQPIITFWNPYNVRLKVPDLTLNIKADQLPIGFSRALNATEIDAVMAPLGHWFQPNRWDGLRLVTNSPNGEMNLAPGETRVYSITDKGARWPAAGAPGFLFKDRAASATFNIKPGIIPGHNGGSGLWLTWHEDDVPAVMKQSTMGFAMRKFNTGRDAIGIDVTLGSVLNWARATPIRFSFGGWATDTGFYLFERLYGPDDPNVPIYAHREVEGTLPENTKPRPFGTFAFGLRMANDGSTLNEYSINDNRVVNSAGFRKADFGIVSRGMLQASPFTCYTELGEKSAEVLVVNGDNQSGTQNGIRYYGCMHPINAPFDLWWRPLSDWKDSYGPQFDPGTFRGYVVSGLDAASGLNTAVVAEQPVTPLQSLADLQAWDARGFNPAPPFVYGLIGNSDASPILPADDVVGRWFNQKLNRAMTRTQVPKAFLQHDDRYCLNHVLFDDWFVSSLAPDYNAWSQLNDDSKGLATVTALKASWAKAIDRSVPLANRAYQPSLNAAELDLASRDSVTWTAPNTFGNSNLTAAGGPRIPDAWLKLGAYLTVNGQFNVNSTSVPAWRAVLGSLRDQRIPVLKSGEASATMDKVGTGRTSLVRMLPSPETLGTSRVTALTGYAALTDAQLDILATEIVKQVRIRGPFLSLSEFVNRQLMAYDGSATDPCLRGALQSALEVLQQSGPSLNERNSMNKSYNLNAATYGKPTTPVVIYSAGNDPTASTGDKLNPAGFSADYINPLASVGNSSEGLPGWPRQADLLRRLAPIMSVRDETFTVRSLGEVMTAEGTARAWCEAVYQRMPEYVDPRIEPWKAPMGDFIPLNGVYPGELPTRPYPYMANAVFGRRIKLVSFRWLRADEI